jgi:hypothetical protein
MLKKERKDEVRRKLLRGAIAAPLLLTVRPAGAQALTSAMACVARNADVSATWPGWQEEKYADEALRVEVPLYNVKASTTQGQTIECYRTDISYYDKNTGNKIADDFTPGLKAELTDSDYALVYIDANGNIVGTYPDSNDGFAVSGSCWASLSPSINV